MNKQKLIHQLFIGKVSDLIGMEKTIKLLKEAKEAFKTEENDSQKTEIDKISEMVAYILPEPDCNDLEIVSSYTSTFKLMFEEFHQTRMNQILKNTLSKTKSNHRQIKKS